MGTKIIGSFFVIFVLGVVVYLSQFDFLSSLTNQALTKVPTSTSLFNRATGTKPTSPAPPSPKPKIPTSTPPATPPPKPPPTPTSTIPLSQIPQGFTLEQISPYFGKVRLSSISPGSATSLSQIALTTNFRTPVGINVSGWRIQGNRGSHIIPQAVIVYDPSGLAGESNIYVKSGETVNIYSTISPIGRNLRLNKCIGYLENHLKFDPRLGLSCPPRDLSGIATMTGRCQDYIRTLTSCKEPADNPPVPFDDYACHTYLDTLNYRSCFERYANDVDFLSTQWRIWTGTKFLDFRHDRVLLLDREGLLVDLRTY